MASAGLIAIGVFTVFILLAALVLRATKKEKYDFDERLSNNVSASAYVREDEKKSFLADLEMKLKQSRVGISVPVYIAICVVTACLIFFVVEFLMDSIIISALTAILGAVFIPRAIIDTLADKKKSEFDAAFAKSLRRLSGSMRSGSSLEQAVEDVAGSDSMPDVIREEYAVLYGSYQYDGNMVKAFHGMYKSTGDEDVKGVAMSIAVANETGADLAEVFDSYASAIMSRKEMEEEGRTMLADTKMETTIICIVPFAFGAILKFLSPEYFDPIFNWAGGMGKYIVVMLYGIVVFAFFYLRKKCDIKL